MIRFLLCTFTLFLPLQALAVEVLTSIKPIQLIVNELTQEVTTPTLLVAANASPHDYALKPSDVKKSKASGSDSVVWLILRAFYDKVGVRTFQCANDQRDSFS